jgi:CRP-like cAMP-binding protein
MLFYSMDQHPLKAHINQIASLTDIQVAAILSAGRKRSLKKNQLLLHEGDRCHADFFVLDGCLRQYYIDEQGKEHVVQFAFADWWISDWHSILYQQPSSYYIEALDASQVLQFDYEVLQSLFQEVPPLAKYFMVIFQRSFAAQQRRILWMQKEAKKRYQEFHSIYGYLEQQLPQAQIASYLGITRESLSRIKKELRNGI